MSRMESSEFWRRGFWIRPALFLLVSLAAVVVSVLFLGEAQDAATANRAVADERFCEAQSESPCIERRAGYLSGPQDNWRSSNDTWQLYREDGVIGTFDVSSAARSDLEQIGDSPAVGLVYQGEVIAVETAEGHRIETVLGGTGAVIFALCAGIAPIGLALILLVIGVADTPLLDRLPLAQKSLGPLLASGAFLTAVPFTWTWPMLRGLGWEIGGIVAACIGAVVIWIAAAEIGWASGGGTRPWHAGKHTKRTL